MTEYAGGSESQVNIYNSRSQYGPSVAALSDGGYVVIWTSGGQDGDDGSGVFAQRYDASGTKVGGEFQVNSYTTRSQYANGVTALADGGYVITWISDGQDGSGFGIYTQRYTASGARVGGEQRVNAHTAGDQVDPDIAGLSDGGYVVTWTVAAQDGGVWDIYAQRYGASGSPLGPEQRVNSDISGFQASAVVSDLADGGYVVAWNSDNGIYAQRFAASGQRLGSEFLVNSDGAVADIARLEDGDFVITSVGSDDSGSGVYVQRYDAAGVAVGGEVLVNTSTSADQFGATVTALADGGYAITWSYDDQWTSGGIYAQVFDSLDARVGGEQLVSSTTDRGARDPAVTALADGSFVVAWGYSGNQPQSGIFSRHFTPVSSMAADSGNNALTGTTARDFIDGAAGNDQIAGLSNDDTLSGGSGSDRLFGGTGHDILSADQSVSFDNGTTVDELYGGAGNDFLFSGFGDIVDGGEGFDTVGLSYVGASAGITGDTAILHQGQPLVAGGGTFQNVERFSDIALTEFDDKMVIGDQHDPATVRAWNGNDHLVGQEVSITMYGGNGHDLLVGGKADDELIGESGDDRLIGYFGIDNLWGGEGFDRFIFVNLDLKDKIVDFERGADKIDLSDLDANTLVAGDQAFTFIGDAGFSGQAGELRGYAGTNSAYFIAGDVDGDTTADIVVEVGITLSGTQLTSSDFLL